MKSSLELDLRWCALFVSLLLTVFFWHVTWFLVLNTCLFAAWVVAYLTVIQRHLDQVQAQFKTRLMDALQKNDRAVLSTLIRSQWKLSSLGRSYVLDSARGMVELLNERPVEAHRYFSRALSAAPFRERATIDINLINTEIALGMTDAAIERCRKVLKYRPNSPIVREKLAALMEDQLSLTS